MRKSTHLTLDAAKLTSTLLTQPVDLLIENSMLTKKKTQLNFFTLVFAIIIIIVIFSHFEFSLQIFSISNRKRNRNQFRILFFLLTEIL